MQGFNGGLGGRGSGLFSHPVLLAVDNRRDSHQQFGVNANRNGEDHKVKSHHAGVYA